MSRFKKTKFLFIFFFFVFAFMALPVRVEAVEPKITDILVTNNRESVLLYARLLNGFKPEMEMAILAGIPVIFTLELGVYQERSFVWDKKIASHEIKRTMKYDNLKKTFSIYTNGNSQPVIFSDLESAQKAMVDFDGIVVAPLSSLTKGKNYYILFKIKIDKVRLPLHMEYVFLFVSYWDFETKWYRQNFSY